MNRTMRGMLMMGALAALATGCQVHKKDRTATTEPVVAPQAMAITSDVPNVVAPGVVSGRLFYPTGSETTSALMLEKSQPAEVIAGQPFEYVLTVKNLTNGKLENVEIVESIPAGMKLADKLDAVTLRVTEGKAAIGVGTLAAGESRVIKVPATATTGGASTSCASISYTTALCLGLNVVSPELKVEKTLPPEVLVCNTIDMNVKVTNTGTGTARGVKVDDALPEGMTTLDGKKDFTVNLGDIPAGKSAGFKVPLKIAKTGSYTNTAKATAENGLTAEASATTVGRKPELVLEKTGPKQQFVGREFTYEINITNKGDAPAANTVVTDNLPDGIVATNASDGGQITTGRVIWNLGTLDKGATKKLTFTARADGMTTAVNKVSAVASCSEQASADWQTVVVGVPAILLEVVDSPDPVVIGEQTTYTIIVTNQGSALGTNIRIVAELEPEMEFVSASGVTNGKLEGNKITFEPLASLAAKAKAAYTVVVKAKSENDVRFKVSMTSDQIKRTVDETESTNFYK
jgi:uncharacterized repeat protein (TIGR01451 family)